MTNHGHQSDTNPASAPTPINAAGPEATATVSDRAAAPEDQALPPLPDGGLATAMPAWLSAPPDQPAAAPTEKIDPTSFLDDDDLPAWLRDLVAHEQRDPTTATLGSTPVVTAPVRTVQVPPRPPNSAGRTDDAGDAPTVTIEKPDPPRLVPGATVDDAPRSASLLPTLIVLVLVVAATLVYLLATNLL